MDVNLKIGVSNVRGIVCISDLWILLYSCVADEANETTTNSSNQANVLFPITIFMIYTILFGYCTKLQCFLCSRDKIVFKVHMVKMNKNI